MLKSFRSLAIWQAILVALVLAPFIIAYAFTMLIYGIAVIIYRLINSPFDYIHGFVKKEGEEVKHATQAVIYFVAFPFIFFVKCIMALMILYMFIVHMAASLLGYIATFGGIKFSPFLLDPVDRSDTNEINHSDLLVNIFIAAGIIIICLSLFFAPVMNWLHDVFNTISYSEFVDAVEEAYLDGDMSYSKYKEFHTAWTNKTINSKTYKDYIYYYLGDDVSKGYDYEWANFIGAAQGIIDLSYLLLTSIYIPVYSVRMKSNDKNELDETEAQEPVAE